MRRLYAGDVAPTALTPVRKTPDEVTKLGIARTFQNIRLFGSLTVFENVLIAKHMRAKQNVFSATLRLNRREEQRMRDEAMELLKMQGLDHLKDEPPPPCPMASSGAWKSPGPWPPPPAFCSLTSRRRA